MLIGVGEGTETTGTEAVACLVRYAFASAVAIPVSNPATAQVVKIPPTTSMERRFHRDSGGDTPCGVVGLASGRVAKFRAAGSSTKEVPEPTPSSTNRRAAGKR